MSATAAVVHYVFNFFVYSGIYNPSLNKYIIALAYDPEKKIGNLVD